MLSQMNSIVQRLSPPSLGLFIAMITALGLSPMASAEIYRWVDADGKVHYGDRASGGQSDGDHKVKLHDNVADTTVRSSEVETSKVIMYSTSWCGYCKKARAMLRQRQVEFTELDIQANQQAKRDYDRLGGKGVPLIVIGSTAIAGFNVAKIRRALEDANL